MMSPMEGAAMDTGLDVREHIARIDRMLAAHDRDRAECTKPWLVALSAMTAGAAFFAAGAAVVKMLG